jgi:hypothetical protein
VKSSIVPNIDWRDVEISPQLLAEREPSAAAVPRKAALPALLGLAQPVKEHRQPRGRAPEGASQDHGYAEHVGASSTNSHRNRQWAALLFESIADKRVHCADRSATPPRRAQWAVIVARQKTYRGSGGCSRSAGHQANRPVDGAGDSIVEEAGRSRQRSGAPKYPPSYGRVKRLGRTDEQPVDGFAADLDKRAQFVGHVELQKS